MADTGSQKDIPLEIKEWRERLQEPYYDQMVVYAENEQDLLQVMDSFRDPSCTHKNDKAGKLHHFDLNHRGENYPMEAALDENKEHVLISYTNDRERSNKFDSIAWAIVEQLVGMVEKDGLTLSYYYSEEAIKKRNPEAYRVYRSRLSSGTFSPMPSRQNLAFELLENGYNVFRFDVKPPQKSLVQRVNNWLNRKPPKWTEKLGL